MPIILFNQAITDLFVGFKSLYLRSRMGEKVTFMIFETLLLYIISNDVNNLVLFVMKPPGSSSLLYQIENIYVIYMMLYKCIPT